MGYGSTSVTYSGADVGPVYLKDIGQRNGLGGGKGIYVLGQDQYLACGHSVRLVSTSDVMLSTTSGVLKNLSDQGVLTVTIVPDA